MPSRILQKYPTQKLFGLRVFLISIITATALFLPFIIMGGGVFYYYGDFNVQEIPFYQLVHDAVRNGDMGWMHNVDLGTDMLSSFSFYLLGSPFFWLTIPFPSEAVPYLIGPLLILKFGCASLSAYLYLKRYVANRNFALVGGLLYAFSGFSIYNVFFFHFHEPMIMFPLLLAALDAFIYDGKRIVFTLAVFSACVVNYYFFVGQVLFVIIYFLMITLTKTYKFKVKNFLLLALEVIIGFLATAFILLPSVLGLMGNPRLAELPNGWDSLVYSQPQKYWLIIFSPFFPRRYACVPCIYTRLKLQMGVCCGMVAACRNDGSYRIFSGLPKKLAQKASRRACCVCVCACFEQYVPAYEQLNLLRKMVLYGRAYACSCNNQGV